MSFSADAAEKAPLTWVQQARVLLESVDRQLRGGLRRQLLQQRLGLLQIAGIKPFRKPPELEEKYYREHPEGLERERPTYREMIESLRAK